MIKKKQNDFTQCIDEESKKIRIRRPLQGDTAWSRGPKSLKFKTLQ